MENKEPESQTPINESNDWSDEDIEDITRVSMEYANELYPEDDFENEAESERKLVKDLLIVSSKTLQEIWDNAEDSAYDDL
jgi:hypothetical protein